MQPTRFSKARYALLIGLILFIYITDNLNVLANIESTNIGVIKSILWLIIGILVLIFPAVRPIGKLKVQGSLYFWAFNFAFIMIVVQILAGLIGGLGKSPYDHSILGMLNNIFSIGTIIFGQEFARHYLVNGFTRKENYRLFIGIAVLMTLIAFPIAEFTGLKSLEEIVKFIAQFLMPEFTKNLLATVLVFYGGAIASILFMGTLGAFYWLSPIIPDLNWITAALVGILTPVFLLSMAQIVYENESRIHSRRNKREENPLSLVITTLVSIVIIWFAVGVFPIYPSVIATGSMIPMIQPGDVILVDKKINPLQLSKGEVIQFRRDNILISHRIIEVLEKDGVKSYKTKGDNNSGPDGQLVKPEDVKGVVVKVVPKIGWPTLLIKSKKDVPLDKVEF